MQKYILMLNLVLVFIACTASKKVVAKNTPAKEPATAETVMTTLIPKTVTKDTLPPDVFKIDTVYQQSTGSCFGKCPVYDVAILNDGTILWKGLKNTDKIGTYIAKLDQKKITELQQNINMVFQQNLFNYYPIQPHEVINDFPLITYKFFDKSRIKKIAINNSSPKIIAEIDTKVHTWFQSSEWIKLDQ